MNLRSLRKKFIIISMSSVIGVLFALMAVINVINWAGMMNSLDERLDMVEDSGGDPGGGFDGGRPPEDGGKMDPDDKKGPRRGLFGMGGGSGFNADSPFDTRFFIVSFDEDGDIIQTDIDRIASISEEEAVSLAGKVYASGRESGLEGGFKYRRCEDTSGQTYYVFVLANRELDTFYRFLCASVAVSVLGVILVFIPIFFLSKRILKPVAESYEKQKRFITDASHELKTPLAIIAADTEVIELENDESEWTVSIRHQIERLSELIEKLVFLSRMDEENTSPNRTRLNLTELAQEVTEGFMAVSVSSDKPIKFSADPDIYYEGDDAMLRQMISLLMDNALKYGREGAPIEVELRVRHHGRHHVRMVQRNAAEGLVQGNYNKLFGRFYREDESRSSETGGSGIGLSVVQAIIRAHNGRISAESPDGRHLEFRILL